MLTSALVEGFLTAKEARRLSPRTLEAYRQRLRVFVERFAELPTEPEQIEAYVAGYENAGQLDTHWRMLSNLYHWAVRRRKIDPADNPMIYAERPRLSRTVPRAFTEAELDRLFAYPHEGYARLMMRLLLRTGLRLGEAMSLHPSDECLRENVIVVEGKTGQREVPCDPELITVLRWMLPWPWKNARVASHTIIKAMRAAGIAGRRASAHTLRHTFARRYRGDTHNLAGIMWGHASKMLGHYRPYSIEDALEEYGQQEWAA